MSKWIWINESWVRSEHVSSITEVRVPQYPRHWGESSEEYDRICLEAYENAPRFTHVRLISDHLIVTKETMTDLLARIVELEEDSKITYQDAASAEDPRHHRD